MAESLAFESILLIDSTAVVNIETMKVPVVSRNMIKYITLDSTDMQERILSGTISNGTFTFTGTAIYGTSANPYQLMQLAVTAVPQVASTISIEVNTDAATTNPIFTFSALVESVEFGELKNDNSIPTITITMQPTTAIALALPE